MCLLASSPGLTLPLRLPLTSTPCALPLCAAVPIAKDLQALGFGLMATYHTAAFLRKEGIKDVQSVLKVQEGRPNAGVRGVACRKLWRNDARRKSKSMCHWSAVSQCTQLDVLLALPCLNPHTTSASCRR